MHCFFEVVTVLEILFNNFTFGVLWTFIGITLVLGARAVSNIGKGFAVVKFTGFAISCFFLVPGVITLFNTLSKVM